MAALTNFMENKFIDFLLRAQALTAIATATAAAGTGPSSVYLGLWTTTLTAASTGVSPGEVSGGSYARVQIVSSLANWAGTQGAGTSVASSGTSGLTSNNNLITFPAPTASWGVVTFLGICDAATGGNMLIWAPLTIPKTVNNGDAAPSFALASFTYSMS